MGWTISPQPALIASRVHALALALVRREAAFIDCRASDLLARPPRHVVGPDVQVRIDPRHPGAPIIDAIVAAPTPAAECAAREESLPSGRAAARSRP